MAPSFLAQQQVVQDFIAQLCILLFVDILSDIEGVSLQLIINNYSPIIIYLVNDFSVIMFCLLRNRRLIIKTFEALNSLFLVLNIF